MREIRFKCDIEQKTSKICQKTGLSEKVNSARKLKFHTED